MPNGTACWFRHTAADGTEDHKYYRGIEPKRKRELDGEYKGVGRLAGVTTVVAPCDFQPNALMRWAAKTNGIGVAELYQRAVSRAEADHEAGFAAAVPDLDWLADSGSIWRALTVAGLTYEDLREARAEEGTNVHKHALYALAAGKEVPDFERLSEAEQGYARGVSAFWLDHEPVTGSAEQVVCDLDLGVAGRYDWEGSLAPCGREGCGCAGQLTLFSALLDAKTSGFISVKSHAQVAGYELLKVTCGFPASRNLFILQVDDGGGYELIPVHAAGEDFVAAFGLYRRTQRISSAAAADRKAREQVVS
jgi:hypothetical protein